jgi:hypothetical protein
MWSAVLTKSITARQDFFYHFLKKLLSLLSISMHSTGNVIPAQHGLRRLAITRRRIENEARFYRLSFRCP